MTLTADDDDDANLSDIMREIRTLRSERRRGASFVGSPEQLSSSSAAAQRHNAPRVAAQAGGVPTLGGAEFVGRRRTQTHAESLHSASLGGGADGLYRSPLLSLSRADAVAAVQHGSRTHGAGFFLSHELSASSPTPDEALALNQELDELSPPPVVAQRPMDFSDPLHALTAIPADARTPRVRRMVSSLTGSGAAPQQATVQAATASQALMAAESAVQLVASQTGETAKLALLLEQARLEAAELRSHMQALQAEDAGMDTAKAESATMSEELKQLSTQLAEAELGNNELREQLQRLGAEAGHETDELHRAATDLAAALAQNERLAPELEHARQEASRLAERAASAETWHAQATASAAELQSLRHDAQDGKRLRPENARLQQEVHDYQTQMQASTEALRTAEAHSQELQQLRVQNRRVDELEELTQTLRLQLLEQRQGAESQITHLQSQNAAAAHNAEAARQVADELAVAKRRIEELSEHYAPMKEEHARKAKQAQTCEEALASATESVTTLSREQEVMTQRLEHATAINRKLQEELQQTRKTDAEESRLRETKLMTQSEQIGDLKYRLDNAARELKAKSAAVEWLQSELASAAKDHEELLAAREQELGNLSDHLSADRERVLRLEQELTKARREHDHQQSALRDQNSAVEAAEQDASEAADAYRKANDSKQKLAMEFRDTRAQLEKCISQLKMLKSKDLHHKQERTKAVAKWRKLAEGRKLKLAAEKRRNSNWERERATFVERVRHLETRGNASQHIEQECEMLRLRLEQLRDRHRDLQDGTESLQSEAVRAQSLASELADARGTLEQSLQAGEQLQAALQDARHSHELLTSQMAKRNADLQEAEKHAAKLETERRHWQKQSLAGSESAWSARVDGIESKMHKMLALQARISTKELDLEREIAAFLPHELAPPRSSVDSLRRENDELERALGDSSRVELHDPYV